MSSEVLKPEPPWWQIALIGRRPQITLLRLLITVLIILSVRQFALLPVRVKGISMLPTYRDGRFTLVNRLAFAFHPPRRGDIVAIRMAGEKVMLMKRIVGLPGETVRFQNGQLYVNDQFIPESYMRLPCDWNEPSKTMKTTEYYFVGDNRSMPAESHEHGVTDRERIVGKAL